jgi:hypothetical protein
VVFEKSGYASVTRPVDITGVPVAEVAVQMERTGRAGGDLRVLGGRTPGAVVGGAAAAEPAVTRTSGAAIANQDVGSAAGEPAGGETRAPLAPVRPKPATDEAPPADAAGGVGILLVHAKPPCEIYIDGVHTGLKTPQRSMELPPGKHKVVLVNNEHGLTETVFVKIEAGKQTRVMKDMMDRVK